MASVRSEQGSASSDLTHGGDDTYGGDAYDTNTAAVRGAYGGDAYDTNTAAVRGAYDGYYAKVTDKNSDSLYAIPYGDEAYEAVNYGGEGYLAVGGAAPVTCTPTGEYLQVAAEQTTASTAPGATDGTGNTAAATHGQRPRLESFYDGFADPQATPALPSTSTNGSADATTGVCTYTGARACTSKIDVGRAYCSTHSCPSTGCGQSKRSKETMCTVCSTPDLYALNERTEPVGAGHF